MHCKLARHARHAINARNASSSRANASRTTRNLPGNGSEIAQQIGEQIRPEMLGDLQIWLKDGQLTARYAQKDKKLPQEKECYAIMYGYYARWGSGLGLKDRNIRDINSRGSVPFA